MTIKQKKAAQILVEKGGSVSGAMREAGYSPLTAKTPQKLTESDGFKSFIKLLPDDQKIALVIHQGLDAFKRDHYSGEIEPDFAERRQTAKLAAELKGYLSKDIQINQQFNASEMGVRFVTTALEADR